MNNVWLIIAIWCVGVGLGGTLTHTSFEREIYLGKKAQIVLNRCENHLPRSENCVLTATPWKEIVEEANEP